MAKIKSEYDCALILTNDLIGGKWKLRILWHIIHGDNRYSLLLKAIKGISSKVLVSQLRELEEVGIIEKHIVEPNPPKVIIYKLCKSYNNMDKLIDKICDFTLLYAANNNIGVNG